jgi:hypothetical protein
MSIYWMKINKIFRFYKKFIWYSGEQIDEKMGVQKEEGIIKWIMDWLKQERLS